MVICADPRSFSMQDNYPKLGVTQLDLSPFYLEEARKNMEYWRRRRGGLLPEDTAAAQDSYLHAPAENIPVDDASFDIVSCCITYARLACRFSRNHPCKLCMFGAYGFRTSILA